MATNLLSFVRNEEGGGMSHGHAEGDPSGGAEAPGGGMHHNDVDGDAASGGASASTNATAGGGDGHSNHALNGGHQMSPFLFIRSTGFFVLFKEANIQSTGAFVGALILSFVFAIISTVLSQIIRGMEERALSGSKTPVKILAGLQHGFRVFLHYVAMLIVMTMNVWLIIAVVAGHALGWMVYALTLHRSLRHTADKPACDC